MSRKRAKHESMRRIGGPVVLAMSLLLTAARPLAAMVYTVNSTADNTTDDAFCTLREAILAARGNSNNTNCGPANSGDDTIRFSVSGTIKLGSPLPEITPAASSGALTIDGGGRSVAVSGEYSYRVFLVESGANLTLNELTVENGAASPPVGLCSCGGGVYNDGTVTIRSSTFANNSAISGGGLYSWIDGTAKIINSTFFGNTATASGGGLTDGSSSVSISFSTFTENSAASGGGLAVFSSSTTVKNSILASNAGGDCHFDFPASFSVEGANMDSDGSCTGFSLSHMTPELDPNGLRNNGGPTDTVALLPTSLAIDAASDCTDIDGDTVATDQRGAARPQGPNCDLGAYEFVPPVLSVPALGFRGLALLALLLAGGALGLLRRS
jgi:CSLREA domain-containing protein